MTSYILLKLSVTIIRIFVAIGQFIQHTFKYETEWEKSLGRWAKEYTIRSSIGSPDIRIRVWSPPRTSTTKIPVHINFHGSGYIIRSTYGTDSDFCERLSLKLGIAVLDCEYAKAPEYPFPHAYTDVTDILRHVIFECGELYDISRLTIGGFSAGGGLAFAASQNDELGRKYIRGIIGVYPYVDVANIPGLVPQASPGATGILLQPFHFKLFRASYARPPHYASDPRISPGLMPADDLAVAMKGKKVCIITGELDNLQPSAYSFVERLRGIGVEVSYENLKDCSHSWDKANIPGSWESERKEQAYNFVFEFMKSVY